MSESSENVLTKQSVNTYRNASGKKIDLEKKKKNSMDKSYESYKKKQHLVYSAIKANGQPSLSSFLSPRKLGFKCL